MTSESHRGAKIPSVCGTNTNGESIGSLVGVCLVILGLAVQRTKTNDEPFLSWKAIGLRSFYPCNEQYNGQR